MKRNFGLSFFVSHERPFDTEKNAIYRFSISLLGPEFQRFEYTKSEDTENGLGTRICDVI